MPRQFPGGPPAGVLDSLLDSVWSLSGNASSAAVPEPYLVSINGHNYLEDLEFKPWKRQAFRATTTPITRTQADTSNEPGETSLSTDSTWRRTQDSLHEGAGQTILDRKTSSEFAYRKSKGINVWTDFQATLLNDTTQVLTSANNNLDLAVCGSHVYVIDGTALKFSSGNLSSWTTVTGTPGATASSITSDGHTVYVAYGGNGIYSTTEGAATASQYVSSAIAPNAIIRFVLGRLMLGTNNLIYNITAGGTLPATPLGTSLFANIVWVDFTAGNGVIFAAGNSGNVGVAYSIQINNDGVNLSAPIVCAQLPNGENIQAIYGYAGSGVALGTSLGFRFSEQALANGVAGTVALTIGPLIPLPNPVVAFSGYNRFIWFTYMNYDTSSTGLGRMDPSVFVANLAPAYASDLMANAQGQVNSIVHYNGAPVFSVTGVGLYMQSTTFVSSGSFDTGLITFDLADPKMPTFVVTQCLPNPTGASIQTLVSLNSGAFVSAGTISTAGISQQTYNTAQTLCQTMEIREILNAGPGNLTSPTWLRHTIKAIPNPPTPTDWTIVIQLRERTLQQGAEVPMTPSTEYAYLESLRAGKVVSTLQVGNNGPFSVTIENIDYLPEQRGSYRGELNGVCVLTIRTVV